MTQSSFSRVWIAVAFGALSACSFEAEPGDLHVICVDPEKIENIRGHISSDVKTSGIFPEDADIIDLSGAFAEAPDGPYPDYPIDLKISMRSYSDVLFTNIASEPRRIVVGGNQQMVEYLLDRLGKQGLLLDRGFFPDEAGGVPLDFCESNS